MDKQAIPQGGYLFLAFNGERSIGQGSTMSNADSEVSEG